MLTLEELEADLFLAERAFKRVPSDQNKQALDKVKSAIESFDPGKTQDQAAAKKTKAPKAQAASKAATPKVTAQKADVTEDSKKK